MACSIFMGKKEKDNKIQCDWKGNEGKIKINI